jgi:hypothetical protein
MRNRAVLRSSISIDQHRPSQRKQTTDDAPSRAARNRRFERTGQEWERLAPLPPAMTPPDRLQRGPTSTPPGPAKGGALNQAGRQQAWGAPWGWADHPSCPAWATAGVGTWATRLTRGRAPTAASTRSASATGPASPSPMVRLAAGQTRPTPGRSGNPPYSLSCMMARVFLPGSMIQAIQAKPRSAMPSSVLRPGRS